jgi:hypothetical protein
MDDETLRHTNDVAAGQRRYEDLQHVLTAHGYRKAVMVDSADALKGIYKIERWTADAKPTVLVTIGDDNLIEVWGSPELWGDGFPHDGGKLVGYLDELLTARRPA